MRRTRFPRILAIVLGMTAPLTSQAGDMRDCRLDALSFVDAWGGGGTFTVDRVGDARAFLCSDAKGDFVKTQTPAEGADCLGRFGDVILEGRFVGWADELQPGMTAIWSEAPAAPCCGWEVYPTAQVPPDRLAGVSWFAKGSAPTLGTIPTAMIEVTTDDTPLVNPLIALICDHPLP